VSLFGLQISLVVLLPEAPMCATFGIVAEAFVLQMVWSGSYPDRNPNRSRWLACGERR